MTQLPEGLAKQIFDFLPQLRLGIDIGQWAGGIGVVRRHDILHAETYTDYHATTLENRRTARRGRRTRHAEKMRLARLRSWILRQTVNGARLPDPYEVMRRKEFQCQPGEYRVGRKQLASKTGKMKDLLGSWVEAVKTGERTDQEAFVIALTLIFQKRGFKWDGSDLEEMTDDQLSEELTKVRLTPQVGEQIQKEIRRRQESPEPDFEGKIAGLERLLQDALQRPRQPRTAEHRSIIEGDLRKVVEAFASHHCPQNRQKWTNDLIRLLNKHVRKARFENRIISGCSWCGKNTPRKSRPIVRELAYRGALMNLRVDETNSRRPLKETEIRYFLDLWDKRSSDKLPTQETLKKKLAALRSQPEMAKQLSELLRSAFPKGRTNLCAQHLEMQARGAFLCSTHRAVCRLQNGTDHAILELVERIGPAKRTTRNPCREAHDERVIRRVEKILFDDDGSPRFGTLPSLITIEFPRPNTAQTYQCPHCQEQLAIDLRLRYKIKALQVISSKPREELYSFSCPFCSEVVQVRAKRQITIQGMRRLIPVTLKNTDAFLRKAKGGLREKKKRTYLSETRNTCIYCEKPIDLSSVETGHIFPRSRGGPSIDSNLVAVCHDCNHPDTGMGSRTPWQWKGQGDENWWQQFERRVYSLPLPIRKKQILLSKEDLFPDNPTALARAGARNRQFIEALKQMLIRHKIPPHQIADNYEPGKIVIQTIDGWMTSRLRQSWLHKPDSTRNFPDKDDTDLRNHGQDAALMAACPPHTWRERIFAFGEYRDRAPTELAPDWKAFERVERPFVSVLGNYEISWKTGFANTKFWRYPRQEDKEPIQRRLLKDLTAKQGKRIKEEKISKQFLKICEEYNVSENSTLPEKALEELQRRLKSVLYLRGKPVEPSEDTENFRRRYPNIRSVQCYTDVGGKPFKVQPRDGPARKTEAKPASEGVVIWIKPGKTLRDAETKDLILSRIHPAPLARFGEEKLQPRVDEGVTPLVTWKRHQFVRLPSISKSKKTYQGGWYRLKEFYEDKIIALPEYAIPDELAKRMGGQKKEGKTKSASSERPLSKSDLLEYFRENPPSA